MAQDTLGMIMAPYNKDKGQVEEGGILPPPIPAQGEFSVDNPCTTNQIS